MEIVINNDLCRTFYEFEIGGVFVYNEFLLMKISDEDENNAIGLDGGAIVSLRCNAKCRAKDCVIVEKNIYENLRLKAGD